MSAHSHLAWALATAVFCCVPLSITPYFFLSLSFLRASLYDLLFSYFSALTAPLFLNCFFSPSFFSSPSSLSLPSSDISTSESCWPFLPCVGGFYLCWMVNSLILFYDFSRLTCYMSWILFWAFSFNSTKLNGTAGYVCFFYCTWFIFCCLSFVLLDFACFSYCCASCLFLFFCCLLLAPLLTFSVRKSLGVCL